MQRIDLGTALAVILEADLDREIEQRIEARLEIRAAVDLASDVADDAAEAGAQELQLPPHPLELMRMGVAPDHDRGALADPKVALPQHHAFGLGEADQLLQGAMDEPRIGRMGDGLRLHRRIDDDALEIPGLDRAGLVRDRQALLDQRDELSLAEALAPTRQRRAVEGQLVAEAQLAAEVLVIGVLDPARAQRLVREVVRVLQDEESGHQPRRQTGLAWSCLTDRGKAPIEEAPVDLRRQPRQRMVQIDDLFQRRPQQVLLPVVPRSRHRPSPRRKPCAQRITTRPKTESQNARKPRSDPAFLAKPITRSP